MAGWNTDYLSQVLGLQGISVRLPWALHGTAR